MRLLDVAQIQDLLLLPFGDSLSFKDASDAFHVIFSFGSADRMLFQFRVDVVLVAHVQHGDASQLFLLVALRRFHALTDDGVIVAQPVVLGEAQRHPSFRRRRKLEFDDVTFGLPTGVFVALRLVGVVFATLEASFGFAAFRQIEFADFDLRQVFRCRRESG